MSKVRPDSGGLAAIRRLAFKVEQMGPAMAVLWYSENDALKSMWDWIRIESSAIPTFLLTHYLFFLTSCNRNSRSYTLQIFNMLSRTCTSASFSDPINELSANSGSNDRVGADKGPADTETAKVDSASTIIDKEATTNKRPVNRETANSDPATTSVDAATSTNIDNEGTTNKGPVHTETAKVDAATSTNINNNTTKI